MKKNLNVQNTLLLTVISRFISIASIFHIAIFLLMKTFALELDNSIFLVFTFLPFFLANLPEVNLTSNLLTSFYCRKNSQQFILDVLKSRFIFLIVFICFTIASLTILDSSKLQAFAQLTPSMAIQSFIMMFALFIFFEFTQTFANLKHRSPNILKLNLKITILFIFYCALAFSTILIMLLLSFALGSFLLLLFLSFAITYHPFAKNFLDKKYRRKFALLSVLIFFLITLALAGLEWINAHHKFLYTKQAVTIIKTRSFFQKPITSKDQVKSFYGWVLWMTENELNPKEYAKAFSILEKYCPPHKRFNTFTIQCKSCVKTWYSVSSKDIESLSEEEITKRTQQLLLESDSEYANLVGLIHYLYLLEPENDLKDKVQSIAMDKNHPLQDLAQKALSQDDFEEELMLLFQAKKYEDGSCSK